MTVNTELSKRIYTGNGVATDYDYDFKIPLAGDLAVSLFDLDGVELPQVLNTDYTVTGAGGDNGGKVLFTVPPPSGYTILLLSDAAYTQPTDFKNQGRFFPETHENAIDRAVILARQNYEAITRSITLPPQVTGVSTELPVPQPSTLFGWNDSSTGFKNFPLSEIATAIAYGDKNYQVFAGTGAQVNFSLSQDPGSLGNLDVSIDGVTKVPVADYTYSGTTLTFTAAPTNGAVILVRYDLAVPVGTALASAVNFQQSGTGASIRSTQTKVREIDYSVKDTGAVGDGVVSDRAAFSQAVTNVQASGGTVSIPAGIYSVGQSGAPGIEIDSPITGEPDVDRRAVTLRGAGAGNTVIKSAVAGQYAIKLTGGTGVDAHGYESHRDFSIVAGVGGSNGLHVFNKAYVALENMTFQGLDTGLLIESVLSSRFSNLVCGNNAAYGCRALKGTGFSGVNSNTFDSCNFRSNVVMGFESAAFVTDLTFVNCNFENNGRHGQASEGGCHLVFDGSEGRAGATFIGGYFESNGGGADLFLSNTGSEYVTVVLIGTVFNRNIAARYVTNCIQTAGKIRLILRGCAFASYNGYTPNAGRPYIAGDASLILEHDGCQFQDAVEAPTVLSISQRLSYSGSVSSAGASLKLPAGWSCSKLGPGSYRVTHNLGFASANDYGVTASTSAGAASFVLAVSKGTNVFDVATVNPSFSGTDAQFDFTMTRI